MASAQEPLLARFILRARFTSQLPSDGSEPVRYMAAFSGADSWMAWNVTLTRTSRSPDDAARADCCALAQEAGVTGGPRLAERGVPEPPAALAIGERKPHIAAKPRCSLRRCDNSK